MPCQRLSTVMDLYRQRPPKTMRMLSSVENLRRIPESYRSSNGRLMEHVLNLAHTAQQDARGAINNAAALTPRYSMCQCVNGWEGLLGHAGIECLLRPKRGSC